MKHVVMGTAGHIDHGKTELVKRLTGIDTDRLVEEKRRGMTIELGFAPLTLPSGNVISIIDVPGHEKFVKTMVAGVTGIDFVMLVIAADEGVMPQTREHIDILSLLGVKSGVVAVTKTDLVDDELLELAEEDVKKELAGTTLEAIPIIPVSSVTGGGIDKLVEVLEQLSAKAAKATASDLFRMNIDRAFTISGYGTVATGTVSGGTVSKGDSVEILPSGLTARIRGLQVHNRNAEQASAGDRCALNLSGIDKDDVERGDVIAGQGIIKPTQMVDAVLYTVKDKDGILHNQRVHVHIGTKEVLARVRVMGTEQIPEASKGYVQLRFEEPVAIIRGDRFIVRSYSPVYTLGGGWVLFHAAQNRHRFSDESIEALSIEENGNLKELVDYILKSSGRMLSVDGIWRELFADKEEIQKILKEENESGRILALRETGKYLSNELLNHYINKINSEFEELYKKYPFRYQIDREELKSKLFNTLEPKDSGALIKCLTENSYFELEGNLIIQKGKAAVQKIFAMKETKMAERKFIDGGLNITNTQQIQKELKLADNKIEEIIKFLIQTGTITDLNDGILIHSDVLKQAICSIRNVIDKQGEATASQIRDLLGVGRKIAIAILEYLDKIGVTKRVEDVRKPGVHYMDYYI